MINLQRSPLDDESVYWLFHHRLGKRCIMRSYFLRRARCRDSEKNVKLVMAAHPASEMKFHHCAIAGPVYAGWATH